MAGAFITFEGGEGAGKSTQVKYLAQALTQQGHSVIITREPGGTPQGEALRALLLEGDKTRWSAHAEALLNYAARDAHLTQVIRPALAENKFVICDRFMDSTRAYQGYAGHSSPVLLDMLEQQIIAPTWPDLTLIFDLDPAVGLARVKQRHAVPPDRFESQDLVFHQELRAGFLAIAAANPLRCKIIDAKASEFEVSRQVLQAVLEKLTWLK